MAASDDDDLTINLKSVALIRAGEKLVVIDKHIITDTRPFQFVLRWLTGDTRTESLEALKTLIEDVTRAINNSANHRHKTELLLLLPGARAGLDRLKTTYDGDCVTVLTLENLCASIDALLREHVFRPRAASI